jgi:putative ABC transport system ATP-binding protein
LSLTINLVKVGKTYGLGEQQQTVLHGIDLQLHSSELVAIMGPSGSGKSTLMNILGLLDRPSTGQYFLQGQETSKLDDEKLAELRNQTIGFVFQSFFLLPRFTALQNVCLPLFYRGINRTKSQALGLQMLEKVGMAAYAQRKPNQLSGGQQQRVAIARALVGQPAMLLADEPTGALDSHIGQEVMDLFIHLNRQEKVTVIIVTHDAKVAQQCQRTIHLQDGQLVQAEA